MNAYIIETMYKVGPSLMIYSRVQTLPKDTSGPTRPLQNEWNRTKEQPTWLIPELYPWPVRDEP